MSGKHYDSCIDCGATLDDSRQICVVCKSPLCNDCDPDHACWDASEDRDETQPEGDPYRGY